MVNRTLEEREAFAQRMNWLVQVTEGTISGFCREYGVDRKTFYGWRSGEYGPTAKLLIRLAHKGVDLNWLLTGKSVKTGEMEDSDA